VLLSLTAAHAQNKPDDTSWSYTPWNYWADEVFAAVDGINGKIDGFGGGANGSSGHCGTDAPLSVPLAQHWGLQLDGDLGSDTGIGDYGGGARPFWRDPAVGLLGVLANLGYGR
jgi:hypothetical protein